jgi:hypothetical protein
VLKYGGVFSIMIWRPSALAVMLASRTKSVACPAAMAARSPVTAQPVRKSGGPMISVSSRSLTRGCRMTCRSASITRSGADGGLKPSRWVLPLMSPMGTGASVPRSAARAASPALDSRASHQQARHAVRRDDRCREHR